MRTIRKYQFSDWNRRIVNRIRYGCQLKALKMPMLLRNAIVTIEENNKIVSALDWKNVGFKIRIYGMQSQLIN